MVRSGNLLWVVMSLKVIEANPVEKISESTRKDYVPTQSLTATLRHCMDRRTNTSSKGPTLTTLYEDGSPRLCPKIVAGLGVPNVSRTSRLEDLPDPATEDKLREVAAINRLESLPWFLEVNQMCVAAIFLRTSGLDDLGNTTVVYINVNDSYDLPGWCTKIEDGRLIQRSIVRIWKSSCPYDSRCAPLRTLRNHNYSKVIQANDASGIRSCGFLQQT
ncbi:hypothetical protein IW261DRAFT_1588594 [Armillaria novae-zelandiae]|uniref:Uncharacterized protein n=1 Tax=Armillaria novae-zelandiae TaxID=153914 RepID=A0AA39TJ57_9AGAR|nr:hypothetical protein IW261DRAFT_1588594 [Armillaria novae-zelandiae]